MADDFGHVHLKTTDPVAAAKYYIDNFGGKMKQEIPGRGCQVDLHGVQLNITTIIPEQNHEQHLGIEHMAVRTEDYPGTMSKLRGSGTTVLEELTSNGRRIAFVRLPFGIDMEVIEKV